MFAAVTYLVGHEYPETQADMKGLPRKWAPVLGKLLAAGRRASDGAHRATLLGTLAACGSCCTSSARSAPTCE